MEIVGANINTSVAGVDEMIAKRDKTALIELCRRQIAWGAGRLALNGATRLSTEVEDMEWMVRTIQAELDILLMPDTPNPDAIAVALKHNRCGRMLVDSITCEQARIAAIMPLVRQYRAPVVVLMHDESGMPQTLEDRLRLMPVVETVAKEYGMEKSDMYLDALVFPLATDGESARNFISCVRALKEAYPAYKTSCGLNNISYGLPAGELLNISFFHLLCAAGQDCAFVELSDAFSGFIAALDALNGKDENCMEYIGAWRAKRLDVLK